MIYMVTGCAGFIGSKVTEFLLKDGHTVIGVDELNHAYDVRLKRWRLKQLEGERGFEFHEVDVRHQTSLRRVFYSYPLDAVNQFGGPRRRPFLRCESMDIL